MFPNSDSIQDNSPIKNFGNYPNLGEASISLSLKRKNRTQKTKQLELEGSQSSYNMDHHEKSILKIEQSPRNESYQFVQVNKESIYFKAAQKRKQQIQVQQQQPQVLIQKGMNPVALQNVNDQSQKIEELKNVIAKHQFIQKWYTGPSYERANENFFIKDDKIIIIEDDTGNDNQDDLKLPEEILKKLVQLRINPTNYVLEKEITLEKIREEGDRQKKIKKETEKKKLIKSSDFKMTTYPAFENFFKNREK